FPLDTAHATPVGAERNPLRPLHQPHVHRAAGMRRRASVSPSRESRSGTELRDTPATHFRLVPPATHSERGFPRGAYRNRTGGSAPSAPRAKDPPLRGALPRDWRPRIRQVTLIGRATSRRGAPTAGGRFRIGSG